MHAGFGCRRGTRAVFSVIARSAAHRKEILIQKASTFSLCENTSGKQTVSPIKERGLPEQRPLKNILRATDTGFSK